MKTTTTTTTINLAPKRIGMFYPGQHWDSIISCSHLWTCYWTDSAQLMTFLDRCRLRSNRTWCSSRATEWFRWADRSDDEEMRFIDSCCQNKDYGILLFSTFVVFGGLVLGCVEADFANIVSFCTDLHNFFKLYRFCANALISEIQQDVATVFGARLILHLAFRCLGFWFYFKIL